MLSPGHMIKEDDLSVLISLYLNSLGAITRGVFVGVHIYDLPITFIPEEQACIRVCIHTEIGGIIQGAVLSIPVVIG